MRKWNNRNPSFHDVTRKLWWIQVAFLLKESEKESKAIQMNLFTKEKQMHRLGKQISGCQRKGREKVFVGHSYPTLCHPVDCSSRCFSIRGILQAGVLEWVAMPSSRGSSRPGKSNPKFALWASSLPSEPPGKPKEEGREG